MWKFVDALQDGDEDRCYRTMQNHLKNAYIALMRI